jgi:predicted  nucleic acid-binding Zn-ribbon protein
MALKASPEDQALLLELQALDTKLAQLDHRAKSLPELAELTALTKQADALKVTLAEQEGGLEDIRLELTRIEADVKVVESRIARDSERLQASSSVKDVAGLEHELTALKKRLDDLEEIELTVMERLEEAEAGAAASTELLNAVAKNIEDVTGARDLALASILEEREAATAARSAIEARLPVDLLALYEKQRSRYGTGASLLRGGVSLASGVKLLEDEMQKIRAAAPDDVLICPSSDAILVRTGESGL